MDNFDNLGGSRNKVQPDEASSVAAASAVDTEETLLPPVAALLSATPVAAASSTFNKLSIVNQEVNTISNKSIKHLLSSKQSSSRFAFDDISKILDPAVCSSSSKKQDNANLDESKDVAQYDIDLNSSDEDLIDTTSKPAPTSSVVRWATARAKLRESAYRDPNLLMQSIQFRPKSSYGGSKEGTNSY